MYFMSISETLQILLQVTEMLMAPIALMFCGHLGKNELDAVALSCSVSNGKSVIILMNLIEQLLSIKK